MNEKKNLAKSQIHKNKLCVISTLRAENQFLVNFAYSKISELHFFAVKKN